MTNLKKLVATVTLMGIIIIGAKDTNAGILMSDATDRDTQACTEVNDDKVDHGLIISSLQSFLKIFTKDETREDCGLIISS